MEWICFLLVVGFAGFTQGVSGFGSGLILLSLLSLFVDVKTIVPVSILLAGIVLNAQLVFHLREHISWKKVFPVFLPALAGMPIGVYFLKVLNASSLKFFIGVVLVSFSVYSLSKNPIRKELSLKWSLLAGFLSGFLSGSIACGGPPVVIYAMTQSWGKDAIKAFLASFFLAIVIATALSQMAAGLVTPRVWILVAAGLPVLVISVALGHFCYGKLNAETYRKIIAILLLIMGAFMIINNISFL